MKKKNHYYSFCVVMGNEDSHILPHPNEKDIEWIVFRLEEIIEQLLEEYNYEWSINKIQRKWN